MTHHTLFLLDDTYKTQAERAFIHMQDGTTHIDQISPPNYEVRKIIENRHQFANPPQHVIRHFTFLNGVPEEYVYLFPPDCPPPRTGLYFYHVNLDFETFLDLAAKEDLLIATQPEPDIDGTTISDEDWLAAQRNKRK